MSLTTYRRKRSFEKTPEPRGASKRASTKSRSFVVQKHAASHLHYDFRLEWGGTLKSWAIPKGPSLNPADKRLAVHVEDHPIEYGGFEGTIPQGQYGGGTVMLWDRGTWALEGDPEKAYRAGKLKFTLEGEKLRGGWSLVRVGGKYGDGKNWLLIKDRDGSATARGISPREDDTSVLSGRTMEQIAGGEKPSGRKSTRVKADATWDSGKPARRKKRSRRVPLSTVGGKVGPLPDPSGLTGAVAAGQPSFVQPQLATLVDEAPAGNEWLHEIKFDGYRILAVKTGKSVRLLSRREKDWTARFPTIERAVSALPGKALILDGEVIAVTKAGVTDFQLLQNQLRKHKTADLRYAAFDLLYFDGYDVRGCALRDRKELLKQILDLHGDTSIIQFSAHLEGSGPELRNSVCRMALEGIVSKRADAPYTSARTRDWLKIKCIHRQEFVIGGYTTPGGSRTGFGALLLGYYDAKGLRYCGRVGTGFTDATLKALSRQLKSLKTADCPFAVPPRRDELGGVTWVRPMLVAEVEYQEWTSDGRLRQPSFEGLREDKKPTEIIREMTHALEEVTDKTDASRRSTRRKAKKIAVLSGDQQIAGVNITHPGRVIFPDTGLTKFELAAYYEAVGEWILPHIAERPISLVRCPQGQSGQCFFQRHLMEAMPDSIHGVKLKGESGVKTYLYIADIVGLVSLIQFGVIEIHPWGSRIDQIEKPDRITFDLDPNPDVSWKRVQQAAVQLRDMLGELDFKSYVKTSGGKGLHVVVPIARRNSWDEVKSFAGTISRALVQTDPSAYIATMSKAKRGGKIFIDYLRNSRSATSVAPYCTRAKPGAAISFPIEWNELAKVNSGDAFDVKTVLARLAKRRRDPWADMDDQRQYIRKAMVRAIAD